MISLEKTATDPFTYHVRRYCKSPHPENLLPLVFAVRHITIKLLTVASYLLHSGTYHDGNGASCGRQ